MRSEKIRKILSETSEETKESVRQYANEKVMEGNEVEKAAEDYAIDSAARTVAKFSFKAGANWQKERENREYEKFTQAYQLRQSEVLNELYAELTRTSKELDDMTTKYNELSRKYDDLYRKQK